MGFKSVAGDFEATYSYLVGPDEKKSNMERKQFLRGSQEGERLTETSASSLLLCLDPQTPTSNYSYTSALPFQSTAETLLTPEMLEHESDSPALHSLLHLKDSFSWTKCEQNSSHSRPQNVEKTPPR